MKLTASKVTEILKYCLFKEEEYPVKGKAPEGAVLAKGIMLGVGLHPDRLAEKRPEIRELLMELPVQFHELSGGGWSFLNFCQDKHGHQWGEHRNCDELIVLGIAAGFIDLTPRDIWDVMPGGMPYVSIRRCVSDGSTAEP